MKKKVPRFKLKMPKCSLLKKHMGVKLEEKERNGKEQQPKQSVEKTSKGLVTLVSQNRGHISIIKSGVPMESRALLDPPWCSGANFSTTNIKSFLKMFKRRERALTTRDATAMPVTPNSEIKIT